MFGYVREYAPELKVKDFAFYKAVYCGLCRCMGRCTGVCSRLTLSYDFVFLALFRMALEHTAFAVERRRCFLHPLKKRPMIQPNPVLEYSARASALLWYAKCKDDIRDTDGAKRLFYRLVQPFLAHAKKRAASDELYEKMDACLDRLSACEAAKTASVDIPAAIFGELTASFFAHGLKETDARIAEAVGFSVGKWIYAADALEDREKDRKSGNYNPFLLTYGETMSLSDTEMVKSAFLHALTELENALDLVDFSDETLRALLYNIVYEGMHRKADEIADRQLSEPSV